MCYSGQLLLRRTIGEAPLIAEDLTADIADIYAFRNPTISGSLVLIMTVNGFSAPAENVTFNFAPDVLYRFNIDNDGNAKPDHTIDFRFTSTVARTAIV